MNNNDLKVNADAIDRITKRNIFLKEIEKNEEKLNMLSKDRLKKLEKYYDNIIKENNKKIEKLKKAI